MLKSYAEFSALHEKLKLDGKLVPPRLPTLSILGDSHKLRSGRFFQGFRKELGIYMNDLIRQVADLEEHPLLHEFVERPERTAWLKNRDPYGYLQVHVREARGIIAGDTGLTESQCTSDAYCVLRLDEWPKGREDLRRRMVRRRTLVCSKTLDPKWKQTFVFQAHVSQPRLHIDLLDEDRLSAHDALGQVDVDLFSVLPPWQKESFNGWLPIEALTERDEVPLDQAHGPRSFDRGEGSRAGARLERMRDEPMGAIHLELKWTHVNNAAYLGTFIAPDALPPAPLPEFDFERVYFPSMKIIELVWADFLAPCIYWLLDILLWRNMRNSLLALPIWAVLCHNMESWPALTCVGVAVFMLSERRTRQVERRPSLQDTEPPIERGKSSKKVALNQSVEQKDEEQHSALIGSVGYLFSARSRNLLQSLQPSINSVADGLKQIHDMHTWRHACSPCVLALWLGLVVLLLLVRFSTVLQFVGLAALVALSPLQLAVRGVFQYYTARCRHRACHPVREPPKEWFSKDYRAAREVARPASRVPTCFG